MEGRCLVRGPSGDNDNFASYRRSSFLSLSLEIKKCLVRAGNLDLSVQSIAKIFLLFFHE